MYTLDLSGKTALITGGTRNIGRAITQYLAEAGWNSDNHSPTPDAVRAKFVVECQDV